MNFYANSDDYLLDGQLGGAMEPFVEESESEKMEKLLNSQGGAAAFEKAIQSRMQAMPQFQDPHQFQQQHPQQFQQQQQQQGWQHPNAPASFNAPVSSGAKSSAALDRSVARDLLATDGISGDKFLADAATKQQRLTALANNAAQTKIDKESLPLAHTVFKIGANVQKLFVAFDCIHKATVAEWGSQTAAILKHTKEGWDLVKEMDKDGDAGVNYSQAAWCMAGANATVAGETYQQQALPVSASNEAFMKLFRENKKNHVAPRST